MSVKTKCPECGYHDYTQYPFMEVRCRGACHKSYIAIPLDKNEALACVNALLERVRSLT